MEDKKDIKAPREREREEDAGIKIFPELVSQLAAGWSPGAEKKMQIISSHANTSL